MLNEAPNDDNSTSWQKWDKWDKEGNMGKRDESSIYNNKQFQMMAAVVAVISILYLAF